MTLSGLRYMEQNGLTAIEHPVSLAHVVCAVQKSIVGWSTISGKMKSKHLIQTFRK